MNLSPRFWQVAAPWALCRSNTSRTPQTCARRCCDASSHDNMNTKPPAHLAAARALGAQDLSQLVLLAHRHHVLAQRRAQVARARKQRLPARARVRRPASTPQPLSLLRACEPVPAGSHDPQHAFPVVCNREPRAAEQQLCHTTACAHSAALPSGPACGGGCLSSG